MGLKSALSNTDWGKQLCTSEAVLNHLTLLFSNLYIRWSQIGSLKLDSLCSYEENSDNCLQPQLELQQHKLGPSSSGVLGAHRGEDKPSINTWWSYWVYSSSIPTACLALKAILILQWTKTEEPNTQHELKKDPLKTIITVLPSVY